MPLLPITTTAKPFRRIALAKILAGMVLVAGCSDDDDANATSSVSGSGASGASGAGEPTGAGASATSSSASGSGAAGATGGNGGSGAGGEAGGPTSLAAAWSTYLGGSAFEQARGVATDAAGNVYVTGGTLSFDHPSTAGVLQPMHHPGPPSDPAIENMDVFVVKLDAQGSLVWATYLGGPNYDRAYGVGVDAAGYVYVAGRAGAGFPVTAGAFQTTFMGGQEAAFYGPQDGFVCKLQPDGSAIVYCSYFGTNDVRIVRSVAVSPDGDVYLGSARTSGSYPSSIANKFVNASSGGEDAVIARVATDGSSIVWARYVGGSNDEDHQTSVRIDGAGDPHLLVTTTSSDMPATSGAWDTTYGGGGDLFASKLAAQDGALIWGTYLGGSGNESTETHELAVDAAGNVVVAAPTSSTDFPTTPGAFQPTYGGGGNDMFVVRLASDGSVLVSTYLGGTENDRPEGTAVDGQGNVCFTGTTTSADFPITPGAMQASLAGTRDAVVVKLSAELLPLYSTYVGGAGDDFGRAAAADSSGNCLFAGQTPSADFPVANAWQPTFAGGTGESFVAKFAPAR